MQGPEFVLFSPSHLGTIAVIIAISIFFPLWVKRQGSETLAHRIATGMAIFVILHEVAKISIRVMVFDFPLVHHLPLHLCSIAIILTAITLAWRHYATYELVYFWGLGGTLQAVLTPDIEFGFPHIFYLTYYVSHGAIIVGALYATLVFGFRPTLRSIPRVFAITVFYAFGVIAPINYLLDTNYLYLCHKPGGASILDFLGPWPWYLVSLAFVACLFFFIYYLPFLIIDLVAKRRSTDATTGGTVATP